MFKITILGGLESDGIRREGGGVFIAADAKFGIIRRVEQMALDHRFVEMNQPLAGHVSHYGTSDEDELIAQAIREDST